MAEKTATSLTIESSSTPSIAQADQEYETDDLASNSEDEKKIRKAKAAAEKKRKEVKGNIGNTSKKF